MIADVSVCWELKQTSTGSQTTAFTLFSDKKFIAEFCFFSCFSLDTISFELTWWSACYQNKDSCDLNQS